MTTENKVWLGVGGAFALAGGIYYFAQTNKNNEVIALQDNSQYADEPTSPVKNPVKIPSSATNPINYENNDVVDQPTAPVIPVRTAEGFYYPPGQNVMASDKGTTTYVTKRKADGNYIGTGEKHVFFQPGDPIGTIVWTSKLSNGTYRYVVKRTGATGRESFHWIADTRHIKPYGKVLPVRGVKVPHRTPYIDKTKVLKFGSKGLEVDILQRLLKIKNDGDFGKNTLNALKSQKKVSQIRLNDWK